MKHGACPPSSRKSPCRSASPGLSLSCTTGLLLPCMAPPKPTSFFGTIVLLVASSQHMCSAVSSSDMVEKTFVGPDGALTIEPHGGKALIRRAGSSSRLVGAAEEPGEGLPPVPPGKYKIFTYWNYPNGADAFVALNVDTWRRHAPPGTEVVMVNESNYRDYIPDAPPELWRLPYDACKSDMVRAAVLYHHGGLRCMDTDFVVTRSLDGVFARLERGEDVVAHSDSEISAAGASGPCDLASGGFSSNFMAARQHNAFSRTWWENIQHKLTRTCGEGEYDTEKVCCHEAFSPEVEQGPCHVPWAHLEWLKAPLSKDPDSWGAPKPDPTRHQRRVRSAEDEELSALLRVAGNATSVLAAVALGNRASAQVPDGTRVFCMRGAEGMAIPNGEVFWQPWDREASATKKVHAQMPAMEFFDARFACRLHGEDLVCSNGDWGKNRKVFPAFFKRTAHHLFFSTQPKKKNTDMTMNFRRSVRTFLIAAVPSLPGSRSAPGAASQARHQGQAGDPERGLAFERDLPQKPRRVRCPRENERSNSWLLVLEAAGAVLLVSSLPSSLLSSPLLPLPPPGHPLAAGSCNRFHHQSLPIISCRLACLAFPVCLAAS
ncbi:unnamed protein product [Prorocentrum cordatum]|uniref:Nucleotide-diphospho-sugar transferase domain-containing protein n=1 Tax=Prorocentrum cordatum TaxID=2364126 RepID=A0ABN9SIQ6_9DINO|nr:unnamed protein product [Polarella glacialis]